MQAALHRARRAAEDLGHLVLRKVVVVAQDDDVTLRIRQGREQALRVENRVDPRAAMVRRLARRFGNVFKRINAAATGPVAAAVDGDLKQPRPERPAAGEAAGRADDSEPGLLVEVIDVPAGGLPGEQANERLLPAPADRRPGRR